MLDFWLDTEFEDAPQDVDYEAQVESMKQALQGFAKYDFRALTRRIKPSALDTVARTLLETCSPDSNEALIVGALGRSLSRLGQKTFFTIREFESQLTKAWKDAAKKATSQ